MTTFHVKHEIDMAYYDVDSLGDHNASPTVLVGSNDDTTHTHEEKSEHGIQSARVENEVSNKEVHVKVEGMTQMHDSCADCYNSSNISLILKIMQPMIMETIM